MSFGRRPVRPVPEKIKKSEEINRLGVYASALSIPRDHRMFTYSHTDGLVALRTMLSRTFTVTYADIFQFLKEDTNLCIVDIECDGRCVACLGKYRHYMQRAPAFLAHSQAKFVMRFGDLYGIPHCDLSVIAMKKGTHIRVTYEVWPPWELERLRAESTTPRGSPAGVTVKFGQNHANAKKGSVPAIVTDILQVGCTLSVQKIVEGTGYSAQDVERTLARMEC